MNNKLIYTLFFIVIIIQIQAQNGVEFTSNCQDTIFYSSPTECSTSNFSIMATATTDCTDNFIEFNFEIDLANDGTIDSSGNASSIISDLPLGTHQITFIAFDFCSQVDSCEILVEVRDTTSPSIIFPIGIQSYVLPSTLEYSLPASQIVDSSTFDNCTPFEDIKFSFSSNPEDTIVDLFNFCCLPNGDGLVHLDIYATDLDGNSSVSSTYINVQDPNGVCGCPYNPAYDSYTPNFDMIENVTYTIHTVYGDTLIFLGPTNQYYWLNLNDTIIPSKNQNPLNGVTTYDLVLISKHILGIELLDSPYKILAADVNLSGSITALDLVTIRSLILHITNEFPSGKSWIFDPAMQIFNDWNYLPHFTGIKLGDVNDSSAPNSLLSSIVETRSPDGELNLWIEDQKIEKGQSYSIPIFSSNFTDVLGGQYTLEFETDALDFQNLEPHSISGLSKENFGLKYSEEGILMLSWSDGQKQTISSNQQLYNIFFKAKQDGQLSNFISVNSTRLRAEAYVEGGQKIEFWDVNLNFKNRAIPKDIEVYPNPFSKQTNFDIYLNKAGDLALYIYDGSGKLILDQNYTFSKGLNKINIQQTDLSNSGLYFYKIQTEQEVFSGKIYHHKE